MVLKFKPDSTARHYLACIPTLTLGIMGRFVHVLLLFMLPNLSCAAADHRRCPFEFVYLI